MSENKKTGTVIVYMYIVKTRFFMPSRLVKNTCLVKLC
jgi:hypothetical protein